MMSYKDVVCKNIFGIQYIERKIEGELLGIELYDEKIEITCQYCGDGIDYLEDDYCEYEENTMCINCFCTCMECGKYDEKDYIGTLNGSDISRPICEDCRDITLIDITESIDWIKNSKQKFNNLEKNTSHQGPLNVSNWLTDKICVGGYPKNKLDLTKLIEAGIDVFICLNDTVDRAEFYKYEIQLPSNKTYINEPIADMNITSDDKIRELCERLVIRMRYGDKIYIHCKGGHGRTGTVAAILLYMLYKLSLQQIFDYVQFSHDQRESNYFGPCYWTKSFDETEPQKQCFALGQVPTPQASCQRKQVERIINKLINKNKKKLK